MPFELKLDRIITACSLRALSMISCHGDMKLLNEALVGSQTYSSIGRFTRIDHLTTLDSYCSLMTSSLRHSGCAFLFSSHTLHAAAALSFSSHCCLFLLEGIHSSVSPQSICLSCGTYWHYYYYLNINWLLTL